MKVALLSFVFMPILVFAQGERPFDELMASQRLRYGVPTDTEFRLHLAAFGQTITKNGVDFDALRDQGLAIDLVEVWDGSKWKLYGFFYKLPPGRHGKKRYFFQAFVPLAMRKTDPRLAPKGLYVGSPGKEQLDTSWLRPDLLPDQIEMVRNGNIDVGMFGGQYKAALTVFLGPSGATAAKTKPSLLFWLVWPDGTWIENGKRMTGERKAPFAFTVVVYYDH